MDAKKLERLRERYGRPDGDLKADVPFREALKQVVDSELYQKKPYGDPPTLLDFPYSEDWSGLEPGDGEMIEVVRPPKRR